ncbi:hypothetical protein [Alkaliflexus imshenetskii]|uniref:hypothetical protein n=1 Tax=Alkaliflexus imshenetskii TaxID=286730 RepID=UPI0012F9C59E|nr:hypothetical protein [Alkaliflexus imshenetskii]
MKNYLDFLPGVITEKLLPATFDKIKSADIRNHLVGFYKVVDKFIVFDEQFSIEYDVQIIKSSYVRNKLMLLNFSVFNGLTVEAVALDSYFLMIKQQTDDFTIVGNGILMDNKIHMKYTVTKGIDYTFDVESTMQRI